MLYRVVHMVFQEDKIKDFIHEFYKKQALIEANEGCHKVYLMEDTRNKNAMATWSLWETEEHLNAYRNSEMFAETWKTVKPMFSEKAKAYSLTKHEVHEDN